jgi:hypothetical protein
MVTAKTQHNLKNAQEYFEEHLCVGDYYDQGQRVAGEWIGLGAEKLGLSGKVRAEDFLRLCENQYPGTGEQLTPRQNTIRTDGTKTKANRRIFYDFTFSPPKSVSIVGFLGNDQRIFEAHNRAVQSALKEFEAFAATRVRVGGVRKERLTGNFLTARFTHDTSRALDPPFRQHLLQLAVLLLQFFELPGLRNIHHPKGPLPPVKRLLVDILFPADLTRTLASVHFPQDADLVFRRIPFAFHRLVLSCVPD